MFAGPLRCCVLSVVFVTGHRFTRCYGACRLPLKCDTNKPQACWWHTKWHLLWGIQGTSGCMCVYMDVEGKLSGKDGSELFQKSMHSFTSAGLRTFWNVPDKASMSEGSIVRSRLWTWHFLFPPSVGVFVRCKMAHTTDPLFGQSITFRALSGLCFSICNIWSWSSCSRKGSTFKSRYRRLLVLNFGLKLFLWAYSLT